MKKINLFSLVLLTAVVVFPGCGEQAKRKLELCPLKAGDNLVYEDISYTRKMGGKEFRRG